MTVSELMAQLDALRTEHGDLDVLIGSSHFGEDPDPHVSRRAAPEPVILI
jgi:hypothetical protein